MLFGFGDIVADLSRLLTLEPGDVILTGTPTGSTVVNPGDVVEVEVSAGEQSSGRLRSPIVEADYLLEPLGAMPRATDTEREAAYGARAWSCTPTATAPTPPPPSRPAPHPATPQPGQAALPLAQVTPPPARPPHHPARPPHSPPASSTVCARCPPRRSPPSCASAG